MAKPFEVTDKTFEEVVLNAELPTVVDFWACLLYTSDAADDWLVVVW